MYVKREICSEKTIAIYRIIQSNLLTSSHRESQSSLSFPLPFNPLHSIDDTRKERELF